LRDITPSEMSKNYSYYSVAEKLDRFDDRELGKNLYGVFK